MKRAFDLVLGVRCDDSLGMPYIVNFASGVDHIARGQSSTGRTASAVPMRSFNMPKFRSMRVGTPAGRHPFAGLMPQVHA